MMFGFYETPARLRAKVDRISPQLGTMFDDDVVSLLWQTPTSDLLDAYGERLLDGVRARGVKRLFIDGLTAFQSSAIDPSRIGNFFSAIANELRVLGVTTIYSLETPDVIRSELRLPFEDASSLAENIILLRYIEKGSGLYRLISVLKARDSDFDPSLHEYTITARGIAIDVTSESAETILSDRPMGRRSREADAPGSTSKPGG